MQWYPFGHHCIGRGRIGLGFKIFKTNVSLTFVRSLTNGEWQAIFLLFRIIWGRDRSKYTKTVQGCFLISKQHHLNSVVINRNKDFLHILLVAPSSKETRTYTLKQFICVNITGSSALCRSNQNSILHSSSQSLCLRCQFWRLLSMKSYQVPVFLRILIPSVVPKCSVRVSH